MSQWDFDLLWKNYGTMENTMISQKTLCYYGQNYGTIQETIELRFTKIKTWQITKNYETLINNRKNYGNIPKRQKFVNKYIALEL